MYKCLQKAIELGGLHPASANGANEESVKLFLNGKIKFTDIAYLNNEAMKMPLKKKTLLLKMSLKQTEKQENM